MASIKVRTSKRLADILSNSAPAGHSVRLEKRNVDPFSSFPPYGENDIIFNANSYGEKYCVIVVTYPPEYCAIPHEFYSRDLASIFLASDRTLDGFIAEFWSAAEI